jgi:succinyl-CoA synthetase alpha subunit
MMQDGQMTPSAIGQEIEGPGRVYFAQPVLDNLLEAMMEIAAEVSVVRDRQDVLETVLAERGIDAAALIEAHVPSAADLARRKAAREGFVARILAGFVKRTDVREG